MEPKFQSSFIPKGPIATASSVAAVKRAPKSLFGFLATLIFAMAVALSLGVFSYNKYLSYQIGKMGADLEAARSNIEPEAINELVRLDGRISSTNMLLNKHTVMTPVFDLIEDNTVSSVKFNTFSMTPTDEGAMIVMEGEARNYTALALQAEAFQGHKSLKNPAFSELSLDESGNVRFTFKAIVDPNLVSYQRNLQARPVSAPAASSTIPTATSSSQVLPRTTSTATSTTSR